MSARPWTWKPGNSLPPATENYVAFAPPRKRIGWIERISHGVYTEYRPQEIPVWLSCHERRSDRGGAGVSPHAPAMPDESAPLRSRGGWRSLYPPVHRPGARAV